MNWIKRFVCFIVSLCILKTMNATHTYAELNHNNMGEDPVEGIDVSAYQKIIDWNKVKASGKKFAIIRAGYTNINAFNLHEDSYFKNNIEGAKQAGLIAGVYYFSQPTSPEEAIQEANYLVSILEPYRDLINFPVFMDYEWSRNPDYEYRANNGSSKDERTAIVRSFLSVIHDAGYQPGIYMSASYYDTEVDYATLDDEFPIWVVAYGNSENVVTKYYHGYYSIHQYTSSGEVDGISGNVDLDTWYTMPIPMYRLYNPNSGEHFYTSSTNEQASLIEEGWKDEGVAWNAVEVSNTPVYRLYNQNGGEHHYTTNIQERDSLVDSGWKYEGIGWYSNDDQTIPLFRLYNPNAFANNHHYTASQEERNNLIAMGWKDENIAWYGRG